MKRLIDKLYKQNNLEDKELLELLKGINEEDIVYLKLKALETRKKYYGDKVFLRGLIEFTNYCSRNCSYCGIQAGNKYAKRYRLTLDQILECCETGYILGYRTFVLQGGEDPYYSDEKMVEIIKQIKNKYPDCAITLSLGEKSYESYKKYYEAGADRYLLRHETADKELYEKIHPGASFENRIQCLWNLKEIGYQVGAGFMVGLPNQTYEHYVKDLRFLKELEPHMVGIGPFIPHKDTIFRDEKAGTVEMTTILLALVRLLLPTVLLPSTTALGTIDPIGREKGLEAGANVIMPNLSPVDVRDKYALYDGKICTGDEAAECRMCIENRIRKAGFTLDLSRGDHLMFSGAVN
ncbi:MAG: [FeFe] hydrogenase H-cluster radical SAM maturase HydE [Epulopiscium sp.]|nr:[FeFe] hydrogenase H-cluster radical SAM maturase HydE [Candidatus Epulonipiscium sp.]HOQ17716.1 [FeFe] hydrogenase H-cluster radical SAM maturase HydE [Defluviitaleaceae bacterium]HPT75582.1 [FeFe] hydrogenase H-cluster radical SAM maturase HydE [Defluviitaleaceae bacterium]